MSVVVNGVKRNLGWGLYYLGHHIFELHPRFHVLRRDERDWAVNIETEDGCWQNVSLCGQVLMKWDAETGAFLKETTAMRPDLALKIGRLCKTCEARA